MPELTERQLQFMARERRFKQLSIFIMLIAMAAVAAAVIFFLQSNRVKLAAKDQEGLLTREIIQLQEKLAEDRQRISALEDSLNHATAIINEYKAATRSRPIKISTNVQVKADKGGEDASQVPVQEKEDRAANKKILIRYYWHDTDPAIATRLEKFLHSQGYTIVAAEELDEQSTWLAEEPAVLYSRKIAARKAQEIARALSKVSGLSFRAKVDEGAGLIKGYQNLQFSVHLVGTK